MICQIPGKSYALYILLILILLVGAGLRFYDWGGKSMRSDEVATLVWSQSLGPILRSTPGQPFWIREPVLYLCTYASLRFGQSEWWVRLPVIIAGVLSIAALYKVGERLLGRLEGIVGAALLAVSPVHIWYSQDARKYAILILLVLLTLLALERALRTGQGRAWLGFGLGSILSLATHSLTGLVLLVEGPWAGVVLLANKRGAGRYWGQWLGLVLCVLLVATFFLPQQLGVLRHKGVAVPEAEDEAESVEGIYSIASTLWTEEIFKRIFLEYAGNNRLVLGLSLGLAGLGLVGTLRRRWDVVLLAALWIGLPMGAILVLQPQHVPATRFLSFWLPIYLLIVGRGVLVLAYSAEGLLARSKKRWVCILPIAGLVIIVLGLALSNQPVLSDYYHQEKQNWRAATALVRQSWQPDEMLATSTDHRARTIRYYAPELLEASVPQTAAELIALAEAHQGLWWIVVRAKSGRYDRGINAWLREQGVRPIIFSGTWSPVYVYHVRKDVSSEQDWLTLLESAVVLAPYDAALQVRLGDAYRAAGRLGDAIAAYGQALRVNPRLLAEEPRFYLRLGLSYYDAHQLGAAKQAFERVMQIDPDNETAQDYLRRIQ